MLAGATAAAAFWAVPTAGRAAISTLLFDPMTMSPTSPVGTDGNGVWNTTTSDWTAGGVAGPWNNSASTDAAIGFNSGSGAYTVVLGANILAEGITVRSGGPGSSYTLNASGYTLAATATTTDGLDVDGGNLTLTNGTFVLGGPSSATNTANLGVAGILRGGTLTLGAGATLAAADIGGDGTAGDIVRFDGGTFRPLANVNVSVNAGSYGYFPQLTGIANAYVAAGGLTVDTSQVVNSRTTFSFATLAQNVQHDPALGSSPDGGLTQVGGGVLNLGYNEAGNNPVFSYTGPTTVAAGVLVLDSNADTAAAGPFPNTQFVVNAGGQLNVPLANGLAGATGTTPLVINGGKVATFDHVSVRLANVTMTGGYLYSFAGTDPSTGVNTSTGTFTFGNGSELRVLAAAGAAPSGPTVARLSSAFVTPEAGSDVRVDAAAELDVNANVVDDVNGPGQLTINGAGSVVLSGPNNTYTGPTTVNGGTLRLGNATGGTVARLTATPTVTVAPGAAFVDQGVLASAPAVTANGSVLFAAYPGPTATEVTTLAGLSIGTNGQVALAASAAGTPRQLLVTGSLAFTGAANASTGRLDLANNDLDVQNGTLALVTTQVAAGYAAGTFAGPGLSSSAAAGDAARLTAVGVAVNADGLGNRLFGSGTAAGLFDGTDPAAADVLVRYTYYGDANLDGKVDGTDYARIDAGYLTQSTPSPLTGWFNGDFNYDGKVDASDYTLIDNAFNLQGGPLSPSSSSSSSSSLVASNTAELASVGTAAVPEPAALGVVAGTLAIACRRRRQPPRSIRR